MKHTSAPFSARGRTLLLASCLGAAACSVPEKGWSDSAAGDDTGEEAAEVVKEGKFSKPLVAYIAGRSLPSGIRFSHASAIIERGRGTAESKVKALGEAGAHVVDKPQELASTVLKLLER